MNDDFSLNLEFGIDPTAATVAVSGDIDMVTAPALVGVLDALIDAGRHRLVIDLVHCGFVDASGVEGFANAARRATTFGGTVTISSATPMTRRALDITGVSELVELVDASNLEPSLSDPVGRPRQRTTAPAAEDESLVPAPRGVTRSSTDVVDAALRLVTALAEATVENADGVSVTLERHGQLMTVAASNDKVWTMDRHQYETGEGPCLEAKAQDRWFYIEALESESRWPAFVPLALDQGIHSILASPLKTRERAQGSLNIYSALTRAFGQREQQLAALFADQASKILTAAAPDSTDDDTDQRFAAALATRQIVHQAQGILMARDGVSADDAIGTLVRSAREADITTVAYATQLVASLRRDSGTA